MDKILKYKCMLKIEECSTYTMTVCNICGKDYSDASVCPHKKGTSYGGTTCTPYSGNICNLCNAAYNGWNCPHIDGQYSYEDAETCEIHTGTVCNLCGGNYDDASSCPHKRGTSYGGTACSPYTMTLCSICDKDYTDASICPHKMGQIYNATVCSTSRVLYCNICNIHYYGSTCPHVKSDYVMDYGNFTTRSMDIDTTNQSIIDSFEEYGKRIESVEIGENNTLQVDYSDETLQDIINRAKLITVSKPHYPVSAKMLEHYLDNTGETYTIRFSSMSDGWDFAFDNKVNQMNELVRAAEAFDRDTWMITPNWYSNSSTKVYEEDANDWKYAVNSYRTYIKAYVQKTGEDSFYSKLYYYMDDCYDWDNTNTTRTFGIVSPYELWTLNSAGLARSYLVKGTIKMEMSWNRGDKYNQMVKVISYE